jgi:hypothetical protein
MHQVAVLGEDLFTASALFQLLISECCAPMVHRLRLYSYVAFTVMAFATVGRAPRLMMLRARDLPPAASMLTLSGEGDASGW